MGPNGVWRRIRWDNVARLAALVALVLLVVAWPRLSGRAPRLPPATAIPVAAAPRSPSGGLGRGRRTAVERRAEANGGASAERRAVKNRARRSKRRRSGARGWSDGGRGSGGRRGSDGR